MRTKRTGGSLVSVILVCLGLAAGGQIVPDLKISVSGDTLSFQLNSFAQTDVWMLQSSTDGEAWEDLVFLEGGRGILGFGVQVDRKALRGVALGPVLFRAARLAEEDLFYRTFLASRLKWRSEGPASYTYVLTSRGQLPSETRYTVVDGETTNFEVISIFPPIFTPASDLTIDDWFETIASAWEQEAVVIDITWDKDLGFPATGYIDYIEFLADEEKSWSMSEVTPLN